MRKARIHDLPFVFNIYTEHLKELGKESFDWLKAIVRSKSKRLLVLVCELYGEIVGFIIAYRKARRAYIESLAVSSRYRGMGVGTKLLTELEGIMAASGVNFVYLSVKSWNTSALNFYLNRGYSIRGVVLLMCAKPSDIDIPATVLSSSYTVLDLSAGRVKSLVNRPITWWSNLLDDVDKFIYRKFYREERTLVVKRDKAVKALVMYNVNDHKLVVDSLALSSYSALEAFTLTLYYLKNIAMAHNTSLIEIPVDASKKRLVTLLENIGFRVCEVEYMMSKELA